MDKEKPNVVGYCHIDRRRFMPQDVFEAWSKHYPDKAKEWRAVTWATDQSSADKNP